LIGIVAESFALNATAGLWLFAQRWRGLNIASFTTNCFLQ
jgi:hypothetical protein